MLGSRLLHLFPTEKSATQTFFHPPIFSLSIHVPSPSLLCFPFQTPLLPPKPFFVRQSSPSLHAFQVPLFYASSSRPLSCFLFSLMPHLFFFFSPYIRISLSNSICSRESTFLSSISLHFFKNQNASLFSCRIFSFHMYAATLIPFSSQNISLTFLSAHTLVRVE